jgi:hypothetical protein
VKARHCSLEGKPHAPNTPSEWPTGFAHQEVGCASDVTTNEPIIAAPIIIAAVTAMKPNIPILFITSLMIEIYS